jgi:hypothetical protein
MTASPEWRSTSNIDVVPRRPRLARALRVVSRRGPIVVLTLIIGLVAALGISTITGVKYRSSALIVVAGSPSTANGANSLAATYAGFIPDDESVQAALAHAIGVTDPKTYPSIGRSLVATVVANSAIISLTFTASTPREAQAGLHTLVSELTTGVLQWIGRGQSTANCFINFVGSTPVTRPPGASIAKAAAVQYYCPLTAAIPLSPAAGNVVTVKDASTGARSTPGSTKTGTLGGALGLLLGLVVAVAWERSDPRTDDLEDLRSEVECPAWEGTLTPANAVSILAHLQQSIPGERTRIGMVKVGRCDPTAVTELQQTVQHADRSQEVGFRDIDLSGQSVLEGLDARTRIVVLCVAQGTPLATLRDTVRRLKELGHAPDWAFLMRSGGVGDASPIPATPGLEELPPVESAPVTNGHLATEGSYVVGPRRRIVERGPADHRISP